VLTWGFVKVGVLHYTNRRLYDDKGFEPVFPTVGAPAWNRTMFLALKERC
jgi:hypothetical protein